MHFLMNLPSWFLKFSLKIICFDGSVLSSQGHYHHSWSGHIVNRSGLYRPRYVPAMCVMMCGYYVNMPSHVHAGHSFDSIWSTSTSAICSAARFNSASGKRPARGE